MHSGAFFPVSSRVNQSASVPDEMLDVHKRLRKMTCDQEQQ